MVDAATTTIEYRLRLPCRRSVKFASRFSQPLEAPISRISRLMPLAILLDENLRDRADLSYTDLAQLGCVAPSRISQIMNLAVPGSGYPGTTSVSPRKRWPRSHL